MNKATTTKKKTDLRRSYFSTRKEGGGGGGGRSIEKGELKWRCTIFLDVGKGGLNHSRNKGIRELSRYCSDL